MPDLICHISLDELNSLVSQVVEKRNVSASAVIDIDDRDYCCVFELSKYKYGESVKIYKKHNDEPLKIERMKCWCGREFKPNPKFYKTVRHGFHSKKCMDEYFAKVNEINA